MRRVSFALPITADFDAMKRKIQAYLTVYHGEVKSYDQMEEGFEGIFHEDFTHTMYGRPIDKNQMRDAVKIFLSKGTKAELLLYKPLGDSTFEITLRFVNPLANSLAHSKGTIKDGKIIRLRAYDDAKPTYREWHNMIGLTVAMQWFRFFIELQNDKSVCSDDIEAVLDGVFYDSMTAAIIRVQLSRRGMRTTSAVPDDFSRASFSLEEIGIIDQHHIEVKVLRDCESSREVLHDIITVRDGAISMIEPFNSSKEITAKKMRLLEKNEFESSNPSLFVH